MRTMITGAFISSLLAVVATPDTALACNPCKPGGSASACRRWILTGNSQSKSVQVTIEGLTTETAAAGSSCAVSVAGLESGRLVAVAVVDDDGALVPGFQFSPAASTARSIGSLAGRGQGFAGRVSRTVPSGISSSLQLTIEILDRVGVPPWGNPASGCRIVAEASPLPIDTIERIWKECPWKTSFASMLQKYAKDVAERHLLR